MATQQFKFPAEVRSYVQSLCKLAQYANAKNTGKWHWQSSSPEHNGVYGHAVSTIEAIITEVCGKEVLDAINNSRHGFNWGGNRTWLDDVEVAVQEAMEQLAAEKEEKAYEVYVFFKDGTYQLKFKADGLDGSLDYAGVEQKGAVTHSNTNIAEVLVYHPYYESWYHADGNHVELTDGWAPDEMARGEQTPAQ